MCHWRLSILNGPEIRYLLSLVLLLSYHNLCIIVMFVAWLIIYTFVKSFSCSYGRHIHHIWSLNCIHIILNVINFIFEPVLRRPSFVLRVAVQVILMYLLYRVSLELLAGSDRYGWKKGISMDLKIVRPMTVVNGHLTIFVIRTVPLCGRHWHWGQNVHTFKPISLLLLPKTSWVPTHLQLVKLTSR